MRLKQIDETKIRINVRSFLMSCLTTYPLCYKMDDQWPMQIFKKKKMNVGNEQTYNIFKQTFTKKNNFLRIARV